MSLRSDPLIEVPEHAQFDTTSQRHRAAEERLHALASRGLTNARCRELYYRSLGIDALCRERERLIRSHLQFVSDVFDPDVDLDAKYPESEDDQ